MIILETFKIILIVIAIFIVVVLIAFFSYRLYLVFAAESILKNRRNNKNFLYHLLAARFGGKWILNGLSLLGGGRDSNIRHYVTSEILFLHRGGLFVIKSLPGNGLIDVRQDNTWYRLINDKAIPFTNPFEQNEVFIRLLKSLFKYENIPNVPIYNIVVFTGKRVKFNQRMNGLLTADYIMPYMSDMKKNRFLSYFEMQRIFSALKKHGRFTSISSERR